jgi:hypothetical protein
VRRIALFVALLWSGAALAQSPTAPGLPAIGPNVVWTPPQWQAEFASKQDYPPPIREIACGGVDDTALLASTTAPGLYLFTSSICNTTLPIVIGLPGVSWLGAGTDSWHNVNLNMHAFGGTRIIYTGPADATKTVLLISPPNGATTHLAGVNIKGISVDCNSRAGIGTEMLSTWASEVQATGIACLNMGVHIGTNDAMVGPDPFDLQFNTIDIFSDQVTTDTLGALIDGVHDPAKRGNTSMNFFRNVDIRHHNGDGLHVGATDNNEFMNTRVIRGGSGGTGDGVVLLCSLASGVIPIPNVPVDNTFHRISYTSFVAQGITQCPGGTATTDNVILHIDKANADPDPVIDTAGGATLYYQSFNNGGENIRMSTGLDIQTLGTSHITLSPGGIGGKFFFDSNQFKMLGTAGGYFDARYVTRRILTDATPSELTLDGANTSNRVTLLTNTAAKFSVDVVCRRTDVGGTEAASWQATGGIANNSDVMQMIGTPTITKWNDASAAAWTLTLIAASPQAFQVIVTGEVGKTLHCAATERLTAAP